MKTHLILIILLSLCYTSILGQDITYYNYAAQKFQTWLSTQQFSKYASVSNVNITNDTIYLDIVGSDKLNNCLTVKSLLNSVTSDNPEILHDLLRQWAFLIDLQNLEETPSVVRIYDKTKSCHLRIYQKYDVINVKGIDLPQGQAMAEEKVEFQHLTKGLMMSSDSAKLSTNISKDSLHTKAKRAIKEFYEKEVEKLLKDQSWIDKLLECNKNLDINFYSSLYKNKLKCTVRNVRHQILGGNQHEVLTIELVFSIHESYIHIDCNIRGKSASGCHIPRESHFEVISEDTYKAQIENHEEQILQVIINSLTSK